MTFRVMMYDFINYHQQYSLLKKNQRKNFRPILVQTYVFYHGEEEWKAPHSLTDRMRIPAVFQKNINTWEIPIIDIKKLNSKNYKEKYNRKLIEGVQAYYEWKKDITKFPNLILPKYIAIIVATIVNDEVLLKFAKETKKEEIEMCIALKMFAEVNKNEGINEGIFQGKVLTLLKILKTKFNNLSEETEELINKSNDECLDRLTMQVAFIQKEDEVKILLQSKLV